LSDAVFIDGMMGRARVLGINALLRPFCSTTAWIEYTHTRRPSSPLLPFHRAAPFPTLTTRAQAVCSDPYPFLTLRTPPLRGEVKQGPTHQDRDATGLDRCFVSAGTGERFPSTSSDQPRACWRSTEMRLSVKLGVKRRVSIDDGSVYRSEGCAVDVIF
jgi:hypothetical protein